MTTPKQDSDFSKVMIGQLSTVFANTAIEAAISFIKNNFTPGQVFDNDALELWAKGNGFVKPDEILLFQHSKTFEY